MISMHGAYVQDFEIQLCLTLSSALFIQTHCPAITLHITWPSHSMIDIPQHVNLHITQQTRSTLGHLKVKEILMHLDESP